MGVHVDIVGTGFHRSAIDNQVIFTPVSGPAVVTGGRSLKVLDKASDLARLTVKVPPGLPVGPTQIQVRNPKTKVVASGVAIDVIEVAPQPRLEIVRGSSAVIRLVGSAGVHFVSGKTTVVPDGRVKVTAVDVVSPTELAVGVVVGGRAAAGPQRLTVQTKLQQAIVDHAFDVVAVTNRNPVASANGPYSGQTSEPIQFSSAGSTDPDGDALSFIWDFGDGATSSSPSPQHAYETPGQYTATLTVTDGRGGSASASATVSITSPVTLTALSVEPIALRFSEVDATAALLVTGHYSDGSERNLTAASTGTTYSSSLDTAASVDDSGLVRARGNGTATITVTNSGLSTSATAIVEIGVTLVELELTPPIVTLRELDATSPMVVRGRFSDGSIRDLTSDPGTRFVIDDTAVAAVSAVGIVRALAPGSTTVRATNTGVSASAAVRVILTDGSGFVRGEIYDDSRGLPLPGASATLLVAGGSDVPVPQPTIADDRGRFAIATAAGAAVIRVERSGFTAVDRHLTLSNGAIATVLDARLTPLDGRVNVIASVFGGEARSADSTATLVIAPGGIDADAALRVTPISSQGLHGVLPLGWSPIAAVDVQPAGRTFPQPATLRLSNADTLPAGATIALARYDQTARAWIAQESGTVTDDRRHIVAAIGGTGQFAFLVPDETPAAPPQAIPGQAVLGVPPATVPDTSTASGLVVPRSAPPGENARATGTVILQPPAPLSSGAVIRARVHEQFDLLDSTRVTPPQFVQDVVVYARPRIGDHGTLAARLPITPSLPFTIQQLSLGTVRLDVSIEEPAASTTIIGSAGGSVADAAGNVLEFAAGALPVDTPVGLLPLSAVELSTPVPAGFTLLSAVLVDVVGASFAIPGQLSIPRPANLDAAAQVLVARVITDMGGGRRLMLVGIGAVSASRVSLQASLPPLLFEGVRSGGEFVFLQAQQPVGFVTGLLEAAPGVGQPATIVTSDTAPFAFRSAPGGSFIVAGRTGTPTTVAAVEIAGASAAGLVTLAALNEVGVINLILAHTAAVVTATTPAANAINVALDAPIVIDFSKPIDVASVSASSVVLRAGAATVALQSVLSANRRRLTITPAAPLQGVTAHTLTLTGLLDTSGVATAPLAPLVFTTLDPSKAPTLRLGALNAELPDEDGLSLITGGAGTSEPGGAVVALNLRTQETATVLAEPDGSFRLRLPVRVGDEISVTLRDANGRETTIAIAQLTSPEGRTAIGAGGGTISGPDGRVGRILPRGLASAGIFAIESSLRPVPSLPAGFAIVDQFALRADGAAFKRLDRLTLSESQNRFAPVTVFGAPFMSSASLTVPDDFLVTASMRFTAEAIDRDGTRRTASAATVVLSATPDTSTVESSVGESFPTVFVSAPRQSAPSVVVEVSAIAPAARIELELPSTSPPPADHEMLLAQVIEIDGATKLSVVDRLSRIDVNGTPRLRTSGRELPGATGGGDYVIVSGPVAFVAGRASGPAALVTADDLPFVFHTDGANGTFIVPVLANAPFVLRFSNAATGGVLGTATGQAQAAGQSANIGSPLAPVTGVLRATALPDSQSVVEIGTPIVFRFSEPIDRATVSPTAIVVTDDNGARVFGRVTIGDGDRVVTFVPSRRWKFGARYRYGVTPSIVAASGARLPQTVTGEFTTFAPASVGTAASDAARDVVAAGNLAAVATVNGLQIVDVASPPSPRLLAQVPIAGGVHAVASVPSPLVDRNGIARTGTFVAVASGDATAGGRLQIFDIGNGGAPVLLGGTNVGAGVPRTIAMTGDGRVLVAVEGVGLVAVQIGTSIPDDPSNPTQAIVSRYPSTGSDNVTGVAVLASRILVTSPTHLHVLDRDSLIFLNRAAFTGLTQIAAISAAAFDVDGDGAISDGETLDLALAAGPDNTLQFINVPDGDDPTLMSAVRLPAPADGVSLDAAEGLAYVGVGPRGVASVDLMGPASIQPLDTDRDGTDDRILGLVDTPASARRVTPALARGLGFVADGAGGVNVLRLLPPRVRIADVRRDPVAVIAGEEQSILSNGIAFTTDDMLQLAIDAALGTDASAVVTMEETPAGNGARMLSFAGGGAAQTLQPGSNLVAVAIGGAESPGTRARFIVRRSSGDVIAAVEVTITPPPSATAALDSLLIGPSPAVVGGSDADELPMGVAGVFEDGLVLNLTTAATGTSYRSNHPEVAAVDSNGLITALGGGRTVVTATNGESRAAAQVIVDRQPRLVRLQNTQPAIALRAAGATQAIPVEGVFSDGSRQPAAEVTGTTFSSSAPQVADIDDTGTITGVGAGEAIVRAVNGSLQAEVAVISEPRAPPSISAIRLQPPTLATSVEDTAVPVGATVIGSGSLDGLTVTFTAAGVRSGQFESITSLDGSTSVVIDQLVNAGELTVTASIIDPSSGQARTDTRTLTVDPPGEREPNDAVAQAALLTFDSIVQGSIGGGDAADTYRLPTGLPGSSSILLTLPEDADATGIVVVARDGAGVEMARFDAVAGGAEAPMAMPAGTVFVSIAGATAAIEYELAIDFDQAPISITSVAPLSGARGTPVAIEGAGFGADRNDVAVLFGTIRGRVVAVTPNRIDAVVPGNAANGPIKVIVRGREAVGPAFTTGIATRPPTYTTRFQPASMIVDPTTGELTLIDRLTIETDVVATRIEVDAMAARLGATVVGFIGGQHLYVLELAGNRSFNALQDLRRQLLADPIVVAASLATFDRADDLYLDLRDIPDLRDQNAFRQMKTFEAIEAIRNTPEFQDRGNLRSVRVAVIDNGFNPGTSTEFQSPLGSVVTEYRETSNQGLVVFDPPLPPLSGDHGTPVVSIIAATNNAALSMGVLNGVVQSGERPYEVDIYSIPDVNGRFNSDDLIAATEQVANSGLYDVVNMSFGSPYSNRPVSQFQTHQQRYRNALQPAAQRTLFVMSGGNNGIDARDHSPCAIALSVTNAMCIGAVATATNHDGTGERADARADFGGTVPPPLRARVCNPQRRNEASNCGRNIQLAAPGEDVMAVQKDGGEFFFRATSAAAPMAAGVAALVQAVRPEEAARMAPDRLRSLLISTADNISQRWNPGNMRRINALSAVRAMLGAPRPQKILVTDDDETGAGFVIGVEIDPLTGLREPIPADDLRLALTFTKSGQTINLLRPGTIVNAGAIDRAYVAVETDGALGDGIAVINTHNYRVIAFIPLSGALFPAPANSTAPPPVKFGSRRPGLVVSKDSRLLYVAASDRLNVINLLTSRVVTRYADLPPPYRPNAAATPVLSLMTRLTNLSTAVANKQIAALTLSADGRTLYLAIRQGGGAGQQPGFVLPVNVDLYSDAGSGPLLQANLANYLSLGGRLAPLGPGPLAGDEPSAIAATRDHVYLVHGGLKEFQTTSPADLDFRKFYGEIARIFVLGGQGTIAGGTFIGVINSSLAFATIFPHLMDELLLDMQVQARSGLTFINAPGVTAAFNPSSPAGAAGTVGEQKWAFTSDVTFGWNPPAENGGRIVNQFRFREVFAKRPHGIAISPDGRRAILPMFQTGNFGVLDLAAQTAFGNAASNAPTLFQGVAGVTPALRLDNHLWPRRGAYTAGNGTFVPSPDEVLLYPGPIEYAQNGRFAAATHLGVNRQRVIVAPLPDFARNNAERLALNSIGFNVAAGASSGTDPVGNPVSSLEPYAFVRGGGALTVLHDDRIANDLSVNAATSVASPTGGVRRFFSQNPVCQTHDPLFPQCTAQVFTQHFTYETTLGATRFSRPRGVSIQPFVSIEAPRFGDVVIGSSTVRFRWRDQAVDRFTIRVLDLGTATAPLNPPIGLTPISRALTVEQRLRQSVAMNFQSMFGNGPRPVDGHRYRIEVTIITATNQTLSSTTIDVGFEQ